MLDHKLIIFYHLAKTPNTRKVAEIVSLSQPAISKNIKELEKELGITLFDREKGRFQLTEAGRYLLSETEPLLAKEREIKFRIEQMRHIFSGTLSIGASTTLSQYILPELLAGFTHTYPGMKIDIVSGNTHQIESEILANNLQLAFIEGIPSQPDIRYQAFLQDELVLVRSAAPPGPEQILKSDLRKLNFAFREKGSGTYNILRKQLHEAGIEIADLPCQLVLGTTEGIKHYLQYSPDCHAFLSIYSLREELAAGKLRIVEIEGLVLERTLYVIHRQGELDPYAQKFLHYVQSLPAIKKRSSSFFKSISSPENK